MTKVKARFDGSVFIPEEPIDLPAGSELEISFVAPTARCEGGPALKSVFEIAEQFSENPDLPSDLAAQHDHYLYGTPKRQHRPERAEMK